MQFALHPDIRFQLRHIGAEQQPLMVVDNVLAEPQALIKAACAAEFYVPEHTRYPGLNARLPDDYYRLIITALRGPLQAAFGLPSSVYLNYFGYFGLVTVPPEDAQPIQNIPHHDGPDPQQLAMVHYLSHEAFGGTGFFRHKATGFQTIGPARRDLYAETASAELEAGKGMANYERIAEVAPVFNRLIVYRGHVLHCALPCDAPLSRDPARGRLTANGFVRPRL
ncbi:hypothetical protein J2X24_001887 [Asticcacaulis solisilvae]|nr:hypothetical protein [Asticcacaulis solisilvae]MDR6800366.1 hypothetical protein [Asticcacaulis sp. BE141]